MGIDLGDGPQKFKVSGTAYYSCLHGPEEDLVSIQVIIAQNEDGSKALWIAGDAENPLIVQMDSGWKIGLFKMM